MKNLISIHIKEIAKLCEAFKVKKMYVFGSITSEKFNDDSDIDFLISFFDNITIQEYSDNYFELHYKLKDILNREIDIITERSLKNPYFIESINSSKQLIYEA